MPPGSLKMEEEDDDLYDPADTLPQNQAQNGDAQQGAPAVNPAEGEEYEEEEVEDDEDDFNIITEAPADATPEVSHPRHVTLRNEPQRSASVDSAAAAKPSTPSVPTKVEGTSPSVAPAKPAAPSKPGSAYPPVHTSTIDVNANPVHPVTGKPLLSTDLDNDFPTEDDKPWRRPGSDISDYFNYGFDEFTWASYCLKQQELRKEVADQKKQLEDMQAFLSMGGLPGLPGAPPGAPTSGPGPAPAPGGLPGLPGMPDMSPEMMQGMLASMMAQGLDPSSMDPMSFMQHAQAMMGGGQPGAGGGQQGQPGFSGQPQGQGFGGQGGNQQQMGFSGYNQQGGFGAGRGRGGGGRRW
ncbi:hypothetical protein VTN77DRAFT_331 [Rasamsonia byssochlamydoides]|uniref:uncharacterized protein n=1 Tax=Rasamsonia byssochlamydoides TaxID=89139 RepID=UPI003742A58E